MEDAINAHQRPKVEVYDETLLVVLKPARYIDHDEVVEIGEIALFVNPEFLISVRHGNPSPLKEVRARLDHDTELAALGPSAVLYAILDRIVDDYEPVVDGLTVDIQEVEEQVFSPGRHNPAERIYYLEREVLDFTARGRAPGPRRRTARDAAVTSDRRRAAALLPRRARPPSARQRPGGSVP